MKKFLGLKPIVWIMIIVGVLLLVCLNKGNVGYAEDDVGGLQGCLVDLDMDCTPPKGGGGHHGQLDCRMGQTAKSDQGPGCNWFTAGRTGSTGWYKYPCDGGEGPNACMAPDFAPGNQLKITWQGVFGIGAGERWYKCGDTHGKNAGFWSTDGERVQLRQMPKG